MFRKSSGFIDYFSKHSVAHLFQLIGAENTSVHKSQFDYDIKNFVGMFLGRLDVVQSDVSEKIVDLTKLYSGIDKKSKISLLQYFASTLGMPIKEVSSLIDKQLLFIEKSKLNEATIDESCFIEPLRNEDIVEGSQSALLYSSTVIYDSSSSENNKSAISSFSSYKDIYLQFMNGFLRNVLGSDGTIPYSIEAKLCPELVEGTDKLGMPIFENADKKEAKYSGAYICTLNLGEIDKDKAFTIFQETSQIINKQFSYLKLDPLIGIAGKKEMQFTSNVSNLFPGLNPKMSTSGRTFTSKGSLFENAVSLLRQGSSYYVSISCTNMDLWDFANCILQAQNHQHNQTTVDTKKMYELMLRYRVKAHMVINPQVDLMNLGEEQLNSLSSKVAFGERNIFMVGLSGTGKTEYSNALLEKNGYIPFIKNGIIKYTKTDTIFIELQESGSSFFGTDDIIKQLYRRKSRLPESKKMVIIVNEFMAELARNIDGFAKLFDDKSIRIIGTANLPYIPQSEVIDTFLGNINKINRRMVYEFFYNTGNEEVLGKMVNYTKSKIAKESAILLTSKIYNQKGTKITKKKQKEVEQFLTTIIGAKLDGWVHFGDHGGMDDEYQGLKLFYGPLRYIGEFFSYFKTLLQGSLENKSVLHVDTIEKSMKNYTYNSMPDDFIIGIYNLCEKLLNKTTQEFARNRSTYAQADSILRYFESKVRTSIDFEPKVKKLADGK